MAQSTGQSRRERARIEAQRRQARAARKRQLAIGGTIVVVVLAVVGAMVGLKLSGGGKGSGASASPSAGASGTVTAPAVPAAALAAAGGATSSLPKFAAGFPSIAKDGKPTVAYVGGEFCPFCAGERWALVIAMSRFGQFSGLQAITSSEESLPTFTFAKAGYTSQYVNFQMTENEDQQHKQLQAVPSNVASEFGQVNAYPFISYDNKYFTVGPQYDVTVLKGKSFEQVRTALANPKSAISKAVYPIANDITATVCKVTGDKPGSVCKGSTIQQLEKQLKTK